ncbi:MULTISPECIES: hypothetical protein [unclassified Microbacterium]|uniref:hypothetical protein n=1 Tax=unclassified Microbacterium TaxID=2609290 RepID=UPI0016054760|nr:MULTISPECIES: hypothetical protein [unclassified Microbacterium]QNA91388.1 hypothetical protein G4G29_01115 [Microbacterium sp. Se63.02b]QYM64550.1 hypothetical protein K1X59_01120 [Microbacterium sp. Se5.02b]
MDEFIRGLGTFAQNYWWLIFPVMGMAGGAAKAWERSSKRRHERRLETLRMKAQLKTAEIEARALTQQSKRRGPSVVDTTASVVPNDLVARLFAEHDEITARWLDYELDVAKLIAFPAMSDGRQPLTAAFLRAKKTADALRPASADAKVSEQQITEYLQAVGDYAVAFEIAEKDARRLRDSTFTGPERKRLERAQQLLKVAVDESATQAERNVAYKRVREELDGLILLSDAAVTVLEKQVARELPAQGTATPAADAEPAPAAETAPAPEPEPMPIVHPLRPAPPRMQPREEA